MTQILGLTVTLAAFWLLLSGHYTPLLLSCGAFSVGLVAWLAARIEIIDSEARPLRWLLRVPRYWLWLGAEILRSALTVGRLVWGPRARYTPGLGSTSVEGMTDVERATYANSITLTPGTLSMIVDKERIKIHALDGRALDSIQAGEMARRLRKAELK